MKIVSLVDHVRKFAQWTALVKVISMSLMRMHVLTAVIVRKFVL
jgi:hypothetical protein